MEFSQQDKDARLAKLLKSQRERQLSGLAGRLFPLLQESHMSEFFGEEEWENFFQKLGEILKSLMSVDPFEKNQALKTECQEVLALVESRDTSQGRKYHSLVNKIHTFFGDNQIFPPVNLPK